MSDVTSSDSTARFEPWTELDGDGETRARTELPSQTSVLQGGVG
jgi:hypothetical protein